LGQKQKRRGFTSDGQFIGSVVDLQMWNSVLNAWQLKVLWEGNSSHPDVNVNLILDNPPTFETELKDGGRCDQECVPGQGCLVWGLHGLPKVLLGPTMPYPAAPCRQPPLYRPYGCFSSGRLKGRQPVLPALWKPHAVRRCLPGQHVVNHDGVEIRCGDCDAGTFSDELGSAVCKKCDPGTHSSSPGSSVGKLLLILG
jgi:hypothetical protein